MEAKRLSIDRMSTLPSILIENILCRVPIRDAVRTSILTKNWRYKWATIPKLVFNEKDMFDKSHEVDQQGNEKKQLTRKCKVLYAIYQVLLMHQGPVLEFTLFMEADSSCVEIDQIIFHLSRKNTVKKLTLDFIWESSYKLPFSIFLLHLLTDLTICNCGFVSSPTFSGFGNLTSLSLIDVKISTETLLHLISSCPLLECLSLEFQSPENEHDSLTLNLNELVKCLRAIEHLSFTSWTIEYFSSQDVPTTLLHLKSLSMSEILFDCESHLHVLFYLIRQSPNIDKIVIRQQEPLDECLNIYGLKLLDDYSDIWLKHLKEFEINEFVGFQFEMKFVKFILAKSPVLKKMKIAYNENLSKVLCILMQFAHL